MIRRPPRSTPLSLHDALPISSVGVSAYTLTAAATRLAAMAPTRARVTFRMEHLLRSEEHTSELQSRPHLVCRLLLEKKKKKRNKNVENTTGELVLNINHTLEV